MENLIIISRDEAISINQKWYFTNIPCKNGHISKRNTSDNKCKECIKQLQRNYRQTNKEELKIKKKEYYESNKESCLNNKKEYYEKNREDICNKVKEYYKNNKNKINEYSSNYNKQNSQKIKAKRKEYTLKNKDKIKEQRQKYMLSDSYRIVRKKEKQNRRAKLKEHRISTIELKKFLNDKDSCYWCDAKIDKKIPYSYHLDHYVPLSKGGLNTIDNIVLSCPTCNMSKSNIDPLVFANKKGKLF